MDNKDFDFLKSLKDAGLSPVNSNDGYGYYSINPAGKRVPLQEYVKRETLDETEGNIKRGSATYAETADGVLIQKKLHSRLVRALGCCPDKWLVFSAKTVPCTACGRWLCPSHNRSWLLNEMPYCKYCFELINATFRKKIQAFSLGIITFKDKVSGYRNARAKAIINALRKANDERRERDLGHDSGSQE